jgi:DNA processing protein
MTEQEYWYWLCNLNQIGDKKINELLMYFHSPIAIFAAKEEELRKINNLREMDIKTIMNERNPKKIEENYGKLSEKGIQFITRNEKTYPLRLKNIYNPPFCLYVRGKLPLENKISLAIVGARNCSNYGKEMAIYFAKELSRHGIQIISGLARGVDGYAHKGALISGYGTYGILGCGIDTCYPTSNLNMFMEMQEKGGVISEYGLGVYPKKGNFPMRNRIISGLSDGILVIEAKCKSGSLITVDMALEQGKDVFALPGRICDDLSQGCNSLIKMGAEIINSPEDILIHYHIDSRQNGMEIKKNDNKLETKEKMVYANLSCIPKHVSQIVEQTGLNASEIMEVLLCLELKEYIKQTTKNYYVI